MYIHRADKKLPNPRMRCTCCSEWVPLNRFPPAGACPYNYDGAHLAPVRRKDSVLICGDCCMYYCQKNRKAENRAKSTLEARLNSCPPDAKLDSKARPMLRCSCCRAWRTMRTTEGKDRFPIICEYSGTTEHPAARLGCDTPHICNDCCPHTCEQMGRYRERMKNKS